jgi:hypothetical protein
MTVAVNACADAFDKKAWFVTLEVGYCTCTCLVTSIVCWSSVVAGAAFGQAVLAHMSKWHVVSSCRLCCCFFCHAWCDPLDIKLALRSFTAISVSAAVPTFKIQWQGTDQGIE